MSDMLAGKNILLTGASRGLGREIARAMARQGANLLLVARSAGALQELQAELTRGGSRVETITADLSLPADVAQIVARAHQTWDRLDVLVNNAAIVGPIGPAWENDWEAWQTTLRIDLLAVVELCRACVPWMIARGGGKIVSLAGGGATSPRPYFSAYAAAKVALVRFSETLAAEVRDAHIQVNCISPGAMDTAMNTAVLQAGPNRAGAVEYERARALAAPQAEFPNQAAELTVWLAAASGDGITGKLISAVWDPWRDLAAHSGDLSATDIYTLRRIVPEDRGRKW